MKEKSVAVILAVFLSYWSWLYTYKQDAVKFWIGLIISCIGIFMLFIPNVIVWLWAIIDQSTKDFKKINKKARGKK